MICENVKGDIEAANKTGLMPLREMTLDSFLPSPLPSQKIC